MNKFSLLQWNINGYFSRLPYIQKILNHESPLIACFQETNFKPSNQPSLSNYNFYRNDRDPTRCDSASGGVATLVHKSIRAKQCTIQSDFEVTVVEVILHKKIQICNVYIPSNKRFSSVDLDNLSNQLRPPFIILGDFNSHNTIWGSTVSNARGKEVEKWFLNKNIHLLNDGSHTYVSMSYNSTSAIDLTFCSNDLGLLLSWDVNKYLHDSDHYPILLKSLEREQVNVHQESFKWHYERADWGGFHAQLDSKHQNMVLNPDTELAIEEFTQDILSACENNIPRSNPQNVKPRVPWWNEDCYKAIKEKNKCYRKYKQTLSAEDSISFKRARAICRKTVWKAKKESWRNFIGSINMNTSSKEAWSKVKRILGKKSEQISIPSLCVGSIHITDKKDIADILVDKFHRNSDLSQHGDVFRSNKEESESQPLNIPTNNSDPYNSPITLKEIERVLLKRKNSAPGMDQISYVMLKKLPKSSLLLLNRIYNRIWYKGEIPQRWKLFVLSPIPKPKRNLETPENYRPITLASCLFKILEKIVNDRLYCTLENLNFFNKIQCGFRKQHNTTDALVHLENHIRDAFINQEHCVAVSLDLLRAYETTWIYRVLKILHGQNLQGNLMFFIKNLHENRIFRVRVGSVYSEPKVQENGICQGLSMSCTLFLIAINDIIDNIHPKVNGCIFADDYTLFMRSKFISEIETCVQSSLDNLTNWTNTSGFLFSPQKCQAIHFCRKRKVHDNPHLSISDHPLHFVNNIKLLGLHFDKKLNFKYHLSELKSDCLKRINLMKLFCNIKWGADYKTLLQLYRSYIRSKLDYASIVYSSASDSSLKVLDTVHHQGVRLALGAFKSSPIKSILSEAGEPPLSSRREILTCNYLLNTLRDPRHLHFNLTKNDSFRLSYDSKVRLEKPLRIRGNLILEKFNVNIQTLDFHSPPPHPAPWTLSPPTIHYDLLKFNKNVNLHQEIQIGFFELAQKFPNYKQIFTDASKNEHSVSSAFCCEETKFSVKLDPRISICNAELISIQYAIYFIISTAPLQVPIPNFVLFSDSLSALQSLQNIISSSPIALEIINLLHEHRRMFHLEFVWVPSHVGIPGNEEADRLAREALTMNSPPVKKVQIQDHKVFLKSKIISSWNNEWTSLMENKLRELKNENKPWIPSFNMSRREQVSLTRLRIGHTNLTHVHLMKREPPPECDTCNCRLTVKHLLKYCNKYQNIRSPNDLYACLSNDENSVLEFLKKSKIKL
ncbi:hypothetical protein M8J77_014609 [Diaphorina citri]|nr:hypothetical protein M8J77_014609 [Diaphorina citri]